MVMEASWVWYNSENYFSNFSFVVFELAISETESSK